MSGFAPCRIHPDLIRICRFFDILILPNFGITINATRLAGFREKDLIVTLGFKWITMALVRTPLRILDVPCIYSDEFIKHMLQCIAFRRKSNAIILFSSLPCERFPAEFVFSNVIAIVSTAIKRNDFWWYPIFFQTCDKFISVHISLSKYF